MAKIRGFKPDLWTDEDFVEVSPFARLLWMGMWNFACDNGHLADKSKQIKMRVLPTDEVNCAELLRELEAQGLIQRSEGWITVPNLSRHQKVDKRYFTTCEMPECKAPDGDSQRETRRVHVENTPGARRVHASAPGDGDGEVKGSDGDRSASAPRRSPERPLPEDFAPSDTHRTYATEHRLDLERELFKFRNHAAANDRRQRNWNAAFTTWLAKGREFAPAVKTDKTHLPEAWR